MVALFKVLILRMQWQLVSILVEKLRYAFVDKFRRESTSILSISISKRNLEKSKTIVKHLRKSICTEKNFHSSAMELPELVHAPPKVSFLKTLVVNLSFFRYDLTLKKENKSYFSVSNRCVSCFVHIVNRYSVYSGFSNNTVISWTYFL